MGVKFQDEGCFIITSYHIHFLKTEIHCKHDTLLHIKAIALKNCPWVHLPHNLVKFEDESCFMNAVLKNNFLWAGYIV